MGKWLLDVINTYNAFWLTFMDKIIAILNAITTGGRKMTVTMFTVFCLTLLGMQTLLTVSKIPDLVILCIAGVAGFFFGINILGDHILNGKKDKPSEDHSKDGD